VTITPTVGGTIRGVVETIHSPLYSSPASVDSMDAIDVVRWQELLQAAPSDPDDRRRFALDLIDRLTAGDRREE
jgi:hypothetical protein